MSRRPSTELTTRLGIEHPIVLAGMGGPAGPELAAAVSNAGGLGVLGAAGQTAETIDEWIRRTRQLTSRPFGVDTLLPRSVPSLADRERLRAEIPPQYWTAQREMQQEFGLPEVPSSLGSHLPMVDHGFFEKQMTAVLDNKVPVYAAGLGSPQRWISDLHAAGTTVISLVGTVRAACRVVDHGVDLVVAQGTEGGGHNSRVGTMALVPQVVDAVGDRVPVLGAGGIGDGRGIVALFALGASGAWIGTRFLVAAEANLPEGQKRKILASGEDDTAVTRYMTGKPARFIKSGLVHEYERRGLPPLEMPKMAMVSSPLAAGAEEAGDFDFSPGAAGQVIGMLRQIQPAAEIVADLVRGIESATAAVRGDRGDG